MEIPGSDSLPANILSTQSQGDTSDSASSTSANSATITGNDFLQLLVTELQNQDPTANTDPNEYIDQLVQVNSLEQLVQINQDLGGSSTTGNSSQTGIGTGVASRNAVSGLGSETNPASGSQPTGNLSGSVPGNEASAALRVANALSGEKLPTPSVSSSGGGTTAPFRSIAAAMNSHRAAGSTTTVSPAR